ncbi:MAG: hypothetical protein R3B09_27025 [Nannocystaceae bacterium]
MTETTSTGDQNLLVIDIGKKQKRKRVRQLRKGTGKLADKIRDMIDDLREDGTLGANAQPVVIVVRQKPKSRGMFGG